jgi:multimeric flavodoxin WrbA
MKAIAINGSPRKNGNTATLLQKSLEGAKSQGAEIEIINLHNLQTKGCSSCFACKRKNAKIPGHCIIKDDITDVLEKIITSDVLILGSPIYFGNLSGELLCLLERLLFSNINYDMVHRSGFKGKIFSAFIFSMNVSKDYLKQTNYENIFNHYSEVMNLFGSKAEILCSCDTYQFDDYSKYEAPMFDEAHKAKVREEQFPIDCQNAYDLGIRLANAYLNLR